MKAWTVISGATVVAVMLYFAWPTPEVTARDRAYGEKVAEATLLQHLPDDFLDSLNAKQAEEGFPDSSIGSIWPPDMDQFGGDALPVWTGTIGELRVLLESREKKNPNSSFP